MRLHFLPQNRNRELEKESRWKLVCTMALNPSMAFLISVYLHCLRIYRLSEKILLLIYTILTKEIQYESKRAIVRHQAGHITNSYALHYTSKVIFPCSRIFQPLIFYNYLFGFLKVTIKRFDQQELGLNALPL